MKKETKKKENKNAGNISSTKRLEELLLETEQELDALEPQIEKLEAQIAKLKNLKLTKQKLITLKLSIKSILENFSLSGNSDAATSVADLELTSIFSHDARQKDERNARKTQDLQMQPSTPSRPSPFQKDRDVVFLPELAFQQVSVALRRKSSLNYELFRAIVFNGGQATTEVIKQYLVDNRIKQPASGASFDQVELTDISSRVNYLVRKGVVESDGRGGFISCYGWQGAASS